MRISSFWTIFRKIQYQNSKKEAANKFEEKNWPCHHICSEVLFDRGTEFKDKKVTELVESQLGVLGVSFTESYMGSNKGTVEGGFKSMQESITEFTSARIDKDKPKSTQHASQKALLTMTDLYKILIAFLRSLF